MQVYDDCFTLAFQSGGLHLNLNADRYTCAPAAFAGLIACRLHESSSALGIGALTGNLRSPMGIINSYQRLICFDSQPCPVLCPEFLIVMNCFRRMIAARIVRSDRKKIGGLFVLPWLRISD